MAKIQQVPCRAPRRALVIHRHADTRRQRAIVPPLRPDTRIRDMMAFERRQYARIVRMGRGQNRPIGLQRRQGGTQFALQMIGMDPLIRCAAIDGT